MCIRDRVKNNRQGGVGIAYYTDIIDSHLFYFRHLVQDGLFIAKIKADLVPNLERPHHGFSLAVQGRVSTRRICVPSNHSPPWGVQRPCTRVLRLRLKIHPPVNSTPCLLSTSDDA